MTGTSIEISRVTSGAVVDEYRQTSAEGIFSAGNVLHVHDLVDNVSEEAFIAGQAAAEYAAGKLPAGATVLVQAGKGVRYALPQRVHKGEGTVRLYFRVDGVYRGKSVVVRSDGMVLKKKKTMVLAPGEMQHIEIEKSLITGVVEVALEE